MTHKKVSSLDIDVLNQIRTLETPVIMKRIQVNIRPTFKLSLRKRWILAINAFVIALVIGLSLLIGTTTDPQPDITFEEVYEELITLQDILHSLQPDTVSEGSASNLMQLAALNPDYVKDYDYLYNLYLDNEIDYSHADHDEYFLIASEHFDLFIDILTMYEYIPLFKWVDSVDNDSIDRFKIMVHDNGYFTIATMSVIEPYYGNEDPYEEYNVFYLGLTDEGNFEIEHIRYDGDINISGYNTDYHYYQYSQNNQTKYITSDQYGMSMDVVSFINNERYYFSKDHENFYDEAIGQTIYSIHHTSFDTNDNYSISFTNDTILSESYTIYNEYGAVFTYQDRNTNDDIIQLQFNLMEATGWDYASFHPTDKEQAGIYKDDVKLFPGLTVHASKAYKNIGIGVILEITEDELTNEVLDLSDYGLYFYNGTIDTDYIDQLMIPDVDSLTSIITIDGNDFATLSDKEALYNSLRSILKNSILVVE